MTNPNNALGTPNAYSGLTSEEGFANNADNFIGTGVVSGFSVSPNNPLGMSVLVGGSAGVPDRANIKNPNGEIFEIHNTSHAQIEVPIATASATNPRVDAIIIYRNFAGTSDSDSVDNPGVVGIIAVAGMPAATPNEPTDVQIRAAITADGATGSSAGYQVVDMVDVPAGATTISSTNIRNIGFPVSIPPEKLKNTAIPAADANGWITRTLGNVHISTQNFSYPNSQKVNGEPVPDTPTLNFSNPVGCNLNASTTSFMQPKIINAPNSSDKLVSALRTTSSTSGQLILKLLTNETGVVNITGGNITLGIIW